MARKRLHWWEIKKQRRQQRFYAAHRIKEKYPQVEEIAVKFTFKDPDWHADPSKQEHTFGPDSKAFFEFDCPYIECINGGFDLTNVISDMIGEANSNRTESLTCQGWQDRERINKHRCLLELTFDISIKYRQGGSWETVS